MKSFFLNRTFLLHLFAAAALTSIFPAGTDLSKIYYEEGFSYLLQGNSAKAKEFLEKAVTEGGQYADPARLELVRILSRSGNSQGLREMLGQFQDQNLVSAAWKEAILGLGDGGNSDASLELALEMPLRFPVSPEADDVLFFSAELLFSRGQYAASLDRLQMILTGYADKDCADDAYYLMSQIFLHPGPYFSPQRARGAVLAFHKNLDKPFFKNSLWKEEMDRLYLNERAF